MLDWSLVIDGLEVETVGGGRRAEQILLIILLVIEIEGDVSFLLLFIAIDGIDLD